MMQRPSFKEYDAAFTAWWGQVQALIPEFANAVPSGLRPQDRAADRQDPYGSFDAGETPEQFATAVIPLIRA